MKPSFAIVPTARLLAARGVALVSLAAAAHGGNLFNLTGGTTDGGVPVNFNEGSSRLTSFVGDLVSGTGQFDLLNNRSFVAALQYAGVPNALRFNISNPGTIWSAQLSSPFQPGLIQQNFTAGTRDQLNEEIKAYLKADGSSDLARFLRAIGMRSVAGVMDGNPASATAQVASMNFMEYGMLPTETAEEKSAADKTSRSGFSMTADASSFRSQGIEGRSYSWTPMIPYTIGESRRVRLELSIPMNYTSIEGADQYRVGAQLGVAVLVVKRTKEQPWLWQVTPHAGALVAGSADMVAGGVMASGGVTSYLSYRLGLWEISMGNHVSVHEGVRVSADNYTFDPQVSQQLVKNGLKIGRSLGQRWYAEVYALDTEFVQSAFTSRFATIGAGFGYRGPKKKGYIMVGGYADLGPQFESAHLQVGSGWKF